MYTTYAHFNCHFPGKPRFQGGHQPVLAFTKCSVDTNFPVHLRVHIGLFVYCRRYVVKIWKSLGIWRGLERGHLGGACYP